MKTSQARSVIAAGLLALGLSAVPATASGQGMEMAKPQSQDVTVQGVVVDVSCKFGQGLTGDQHRMCAQVCADRGIPLAILADDGTLYIPTSAGMPGDNQNGRLKEFAEQRVRVRGKSFAAGGARALQITTVQRL